MLQIMRFGDGDVEDDEVQGNDVEGDDGNGDPKTEYMVCEPVLSMFARR